MNFKRITICFALSLIVTLPTQGQVRLGTRSIIQGGNVKELTPTARWNGLVNNKALLTLVPKGGFVTDSKTFSKLCLTWAPKSTVPTIDFDKELILIGTVQGTNRATIKPLLDKNGNLTALVGGIRRLGVPGFAYAIISVSRKDIKSVHSVALPSGTTTTLPKSGSGSKKDFVKVTIRGDLKTTLTDNFIKANLITYELDFGKNTILRNSVSKLGGKKLLIAGSVSVRKGKLYQVLTVDTISLVK